jgi:hypothetical protein
MSADEFKKADQYAQAQCSVDEIALLLNTTAEGLKRQFHEINGDDADFTKWHESKAASGRALLKVARFKTAVEGNASAINAITAEIEQQRQNNEKPRGFGTKPKRKPSPE